MPQQHTTNPLYDLVRQGLPNDAWLLHVVGFKFPASVTIEEQRVLMGECNALQRACGGIEAGIVSIQAKENIDPRKGFTWVEVSTFVSAEAFIAFHAHPAHKQFANRMAGTADVWVVLDIPIQPGSAPLVRD